jgi:uncharacterized protein YuzE
MTFEYDDLADVMHIEFAEPNSKCTYMNSASGAILRIEESTGRIVGARVLGWQRILERGRLTIPEMEDMRFSAQWIEDHRK